jgi:hypothetical protein
MAELKNWADVQGVGGLVPSTPFLKTIHWEAVNPSTYEVTQYDAEVWLLKLGAGAYMDVFADKKTVQDFEAEFISRSWLLENDKGKKELCTFERARQLDPPLRKAIAQEIGLLCGLQKKASPTTTNSSANSSSTESAEVPLLKLANG